MKKICFVMSVLLVLCLVGCATYKVQQVSVHHASSYLHKQTLHDITIACDPFDTADKAKSAFYIDVTKKGYYPINIIITNNSPNQVAVIKQKIQLHDVTGGVNLPVDSAVVVDQFEHNALMEAFWGFGIFSYMAAEDANKKMKADWYEKELPEEKILKPGRAMHGFVFFKPRTSAKVISNSIVEVKLQDLKTERYMDFEVRL